MATQTKKQSTIKLEGALKPVPSRQEALKRIMDVMLPWLRRVYHVSEKVMQVITPYNYKVAVIVPQGHGMTYMCMLLVEELKKMYDSANALADMSQVFLTENGSMLTLKLFLGLEEPEKGALPIVISDGYRKPTQFEQAANPSMDFKRFIKDRAAILFLSHENQLTEFDHDFRVIKVPPLNEAELLAIATANHLVNPKDKEQMDAAKKFCSKSVKPKTILQFISQGRSVPQGTPTIEDVAAMPEPEEAERTGNAIHIFDQFSVERFNQVAYNESTLSLFDQVEIDEIEKVVKDVVHGQDHAIDILIDTIAVAKYNMKDKQKPAISCLFAGPTGVGKTFLAQTLSKALYGTDKIIRIDMGEYNQGHHVEKLLGSAPGYVGYGEDTPLVRGIRQNKDAIILFDEIEKAHPAVHNMLLALLDEGIVTSGKGETFDIRNNIIIMTSNAIISEKDIRVKGKIGFENPSLGMVASVNEAVDIEKKVRHHLIEQKVFRPEFVNRIDAICLFNELRQQEAERIIIDQIETLKEQLADAGYTLEYTEEDITNIFKTEYDSKFGGRSIRRCVEAKKKLIARTLRTSPRTKTIVLGSVKQ